MKATNATRLPHLGTKAEFTKQAKAFVAFKATQGITLPATYVTEMRKFWEFKKAQLARR